MSKKIIVVGILVVFVGLAGLYILQSDDLNTEWKTYRDEQYGFEMQYPPEWTPQFVRGQFAGFYDKSYKDDWLENFYESIRVSGPEVTDFAEMKRLFLEREGREISLTDYLVWLNKNVNLGSDEDPIMTELITADGTVAIRVEGFVGIVVTPGIYVEVNVPVPGEKVYAFTASEQHSSALDRMISTFRAID
jgi:hypothetical protein